MSVELPGAPSAPVPWGTEPVTAGRREACPLWALSREEALRPPRCLACISPRAVTLHNKQMIKDHQALAQGSQECPRRLLFTPCQQGRSAKHPEQGSHQVNSPGGVAAARRRHCLLVPPVHMAPLRVPSSGATVKHELRTGCLWPDATTQGPWNAASASEKCGKGPHAELGRDG